MDSFFRLFNLIERNMNIYDASLKKVVDINFYELYSKKESNFSSLDEIFNWIQEVVYKAVSEMSRRRGNYEHIPDKSIGDVKKYMQENLNRNITLQQVANYIHMNPNYFSGWFKQKTGQNYVDYLRPESVNF